MIKRIYGDTTRHGTKHRSVLRPTLMAIGMCLLGVAYSGQTFSNAEIPAGEKDQQPQAPLYYADLGWRTAAGVANALEAATRVIAENPAAKIEFLVHGKDMRLFIDGATRRKPRIVALSNLLASNQVKFRVCDHALVYKGVSLAHFPGHFETVKYVPERVKELQRQGYRDLHTPPP